MTLNFFFSNFNCCSSHLFLGRIPLTKLPIPSLICSLMVFLRDFYFLLILCPFDHWLIIAHIQRLITGSVFMSFMRVFTSRRRTFLACLAALHFSTWSQVSTFSSHKGHNPQVICPQLPFLPLVSQSW